MKNLMKLAVGAAMLGGLAVTAAAPASAGVSVGVGIGVPGPAYGPAYPHRAWCYHHPRRCGYAPGYYGPGYVGPAPVIGVYYSNRGWWDGHRYWAHRYAWHGGWRYR